jgi:hypothetical protein
MFHQQLRSRTMELTALMATCDSQIVCKQALTPQTLFVGSPLAGNSQAIARKRESYDSQTL